MSDSSFLYQETRYWNFLPPPTRPRLGAAAPPDSEDLSLSPSRPDAPRTPSQPRFSCTGWQIFAGIAAALLCIFLYYPTPPLHACTSQASAAVHRLALARSNLTHGVTLATNNDGDDSLTLLLTRIDALGADIMVLADYCQRGGTHLHAHALHLSEHMAQTCPWVLALVDSAMGSFQSTQIDKNKEARLHTLWLDAGAGIKQVCHDMETLCRGLAV